MAVVYLKNEDYAAYTMEMLDLIDQYPIFDHY